LDPKRPGRHSGLAYLGNRAAPGSLAALFLPDTFFSFPASKPSDNILQESAIDDFEVILEVLAGNRDAYAQLVRKYETRVRGYCLMMLSQAAEAEDAAQEVFIKAFQALGTFHGKAAFSTWLYRISVNVCYDILRKRQRRKTQSWDALLEKEGEKAEALFASSADPRPEESVELVAQLLAGLPDKAREIIVLRDMQGLSYEEIAETLSCTLDAVKSRLKRARREMTLKLRHFLGPRASKL
jgi:RNA polymerase sigma-70 factor (ECF subfamily)